MSVVREPEGRITAAILTRDEAVHLPACLQSVAWADAVLVLDSDSVDATRDIARQNGARVEIQSFENFSIQRQRALELVETEWVLFVDADERVSPELAGEVRHAIAHQDADAYWIPRVNDFWGHRLRSGGWWPDHQLRLLRVAACYYDPRRAVHEVAEVDGSIGKLEVPLHHLNYASMREFVSKQRDYARLEADRRITVGQTAALRHLLTRPAQEFVRRFFTLRGYRDGVLGARLAAVMAWTELVTIADVRRRQRGGPDREP